MLDIPCWGQQIKSRNEDDYLLPTLRQIFQRANMREIYVADIPNDEQLRLMIKLLQLTSEPMPMGTIVESAKQKLLESCRLKEVYSDPTGEKLAADRKAVTYSFLYRKPSATLTAAEVDAAHGELLKALAAKLPEVRYR